MMADILILYNGCAFSDDGETMILFNPQFVLEAFKVVDSEKPLCICTSNKGPMFIRGNEYEFLILPVYNANAVANATNRIPKLMNTSCCFAKNAK